MSNGHYQFTGSSTDRLARDTTIGASNLSRAVMFVLTSAADWGAVNGVLIAVGRDGAQWAYTRTSPTGLRVVVRRGTFTGHDFPWPTSPELPADTRVWFAVEMIGDNGSGGYSVVVYYATTDVAIGRPAFPSVAWTEFGRYDGVDDSGLLFDSSQSPNGFVYLGAREAAIDSFTDGYSDRIYAAEVTNLSGTPTVLAGVDFRTDERTGTDPDTWDDTATGTWTEVGALTYVEPTGGSTQDVYPVADEHVGTYWRDPDGGLSHWSATAEQTQDAVVGIDVSDLGALTHEQRTWRTRYGAPSSTPDPAGTRTVRVECGRFGATDCDLELRVYEAGDGNVGSGTLRGSATVTPAASIVVGDMTYLDVTFDDLTDWTNGFSVEKTVVPPL